MKNRNPKLVAQIEVTRAKNMLKVAKNEGWTVEQTEQWKERLWRAERYLKGFV